MSIFGFGKKNVSRREMQQVKTYANFSKRDRKNLDIIFRGDLNEEGRQKGIDEKELKKGITWMRDNMSKHSLTKKEIDDFERRAHKKL
jgi:hypothetical protein